MGRDAKLAKGEARTGVAATATKVNASAFRELERHLTDALEQQAATSEILRLISDSKNDAQPVFEGIAASALRLCDGRFSTVFRFDGRLIHIAAFCNASPEGTEAFHKAYPCPPSRGGNTQRAILTRSIVHVPDVLEDSEYVYQTAAAAAGFRSALSVPMLRGGEPIGAISVFRAPATAFPDSHIKLLRAFADQAVIAIENVRLFNETKAALERQTATAEILRVISGSPTRLDPVLDAVAGATARLCGAPDVLILRVHDGALRGATGVGQFAEVVRQRAGSIGALEIPITRGSISGRAVFDRRTVHVHDLAAEREDEYPVGRELQRRFGHHTCVATPLLREGVPLGVICLFRMEVNPFSDNQIALLQTFADQAVIAIENVRLFNETKEALEQQTATSEILGVISRSPTDVQPVFDTIADTAVRLCAGTFATVVRYDGEVVHIEALASSWKREEADAIRRLYPMSPSRGTIASRAVLVRDVVNIPDVQEDAEYAIRDVARSAGYRSAVGVPLLLRGVPIGAIGVGRPETGVFPEKQIALLKTFADQAVIAIENVRLFTELEARTSELTQSVKELKALGDVGQAVSSTIDLETVLSTIVSRAAQLAGMDGGSIWEYDEAGEAFYLHATDRLPNDLAETLRAIPMRKGEGALGRLAVTREPVEIPDFADERNYRNRDILIRSGFRSVLAVPLLREDHLLGALAVNRSSPGGFAPKVIDLLKTFATQSALAIQNARLYREIERKSRELESASRHKSEFLANMSHELRTPLNAIIGFSEVLSERMFGDINEKQAEYIGDILQSGQHLLSLINDILDLSKIEAGRMELELNDFNLPGTIDQTVMLVRERAVRRGITLRRTIDERLGSIRADERKVKQVLLNLLSNAVKFTPQGGKIDVRAAMNDGVAEVSVTDTGVGIAPEDQAAVFEEFRQVGTASRNVEGTGLGLTISRKFIELHGGRIWVTSQVGAGSTFTFTLPVPGAPRT